MSATAQAPVAASLTLTPDNPSNTTIYDEDGKALYAVNTEHSKSATVTYVRNADEEVLGSLEWRDVLADRITVGKRGPMSLRDWLRTSMVPFYFKHDVSFEDDAGRKYKWRGNAPGRALELYTEDDGFKAPISRFHKSRKDRASGKVTPATLVFTARGLEIRDTVVLSFLFLEKGRRVNETTAQSFADVSSTPTLSAVTGHDYNVRDGGVGV